MIRMCLHNFLYQFYVRNTCLKLQHMYSYRIAHLLMLQLVAYQVHSVSNPSLLKMIGLVATCGCGYNYLREIQWPLLIQRLKVILLEFLVIRRRSFWYWLSLDDLFFAIVKTSRGLCSSYIKLSGAEGQSVAVLTVTALQSYEMLNLFWEKVEKENLNIYVCKRNTVSTSKKSNRRLFKVLYPNNPKDFYHATCFL